MGQARDVFDILLHRAGEADRIAALSSLKAHCEQQDVPVEEQSIRGFKYLRITIKAERIDEPLSVAFTSDIQKLVSVKLGRLRFLTAYRGIFYLDEKSVEVLLEPTAEFDTASLAATIPEQGDRFIVPAPPEGRFKDVEISLGRPSSELALLSSLRRTEEPLVPPGLGNAGSTDIYLTSRCLSMRVVGLSTKTHEEACRVVEQVIFSLVLSMESHGAPFQVMRVEPEVSSLPTEVKKTTLEGLTFPSTVYDPEPSALYWYGASVKQQPLLQFLAYYQVIEHYFPRYSQLQAGERVKALLMTPGFSPHHQADIQRLVGAIQGGKRSKEITQFIDTMNACVDADELRAFLASNSGLWSFLAKKEPEISSVQIPMNNNVDMDLRADLARRLYDIRCRIVHAKEEGDPFGDSERILPFSKAAAKLASDNEVLRWVAQRVLFRSGSAITV